MLPLISACESPKALPQRLRPPPRSLSKQHLGLSARNTVLGKVPNDSSQLEGPRDGGEIGEIGEQYQRNRHGIEESDKPKPTTTQVVSDDIAVRAGRLRRFDLHQ